MKNLLDFDVHGKDGTVTHGTVNVKKVCLARHCGRDREATAKVLDSFRAQGYQAHGNPSICRKSRHLITNENTIEVQGPQTSGEVEIVAVVDGDKVLISVGSDNGDRSVESMWTDALGDVYDTAKTKQMSPCVVAKDAWWYDDVKDTWDNLNLKAYVTVDGKKLLYQDFKMSRLLTLDYHFETSPYLKEDGTAFYLGTADVVQGLPPTLYAFQQHIKGLFFPADFHFEMHDPTSGRSISHYYSIESIEPHGSLSL